MMQPSPASFVPQRRIMKASEAGVLTSASAVVAARHADADAVLAQARIDAEAITALAQAEAEDLIRNAWADAREDAARHEASRAHSATIECLARADAAIATLEQRLPELVIGIVRSIIGAMDDTSLATHLVRRHLGALRAEWPLTISVPGGERDGLGHALQRALQAAGRVATIDPVPVGEDDGIRITTPFGTLDVSPTARLEDLRETWAPLFAPGA